MTRRHGQSGFTLVEVIVSIVTAAILGTLLVAYMQSVFIKGGQQVTDVGGLHQATQAMDGLTAAYNSQIHLAVTQTGGQDALDFVAARTADSSFDPFNVTLGWFSGPPFTGTGSGTRGTGHDFLKVTLTPNGGGPSLTSIFWSGN
ncbi:MAG: type II secretion system protein [Thermodesulfobacteriota bacterium]